VLFGGQGSNVMLPIAERLGNSALDLQLILICGRNEKLKKRLARFRTRNRIFVEGFTKQIPFYMHLSDFLIGKPGPGICQFFAVPMGGQTYLSIRFFLFGDNAAATVADVQPEWSRWFTERFPMGG